MTSPATISRPKAKTRPAKRTCLSCGKTFASKGIHNRICRPCHYQLAEIDGDSHALVPR